MRNATYAETQTSKDPARVALLSILILWFISNFINSNISKLFLIEDQEWTISGLMSTQERNYELNQFFHKLLVVLQNNLVVYITLASCCHLH